ncbi:hypothetical protein GCM10010289_08060 [Streptomyces violascens]|uniref:Uncharacterized protein n=1 Tax=Streptomyces violascens TaxID=67381 RepID=A0ABQ3QGQ8_9ACTN|nr:hypothetical protein GCM10010289_08060 [Streptomyces violascens]GHI36471.1 hypothetical protein Sviol_08790 [Streptomyces violascens]
MVPHHISGWPAHSYGVATRIVPAHRPEVVPMAASATAPPPATNLKRIVAASLIGTTIEW